MKMKRRPRQDGGWRSRANKVMRTEPNMHGKMSKRQMSKAMVVSELVYNVMFILALCFLLFHLCWSVFDGISPTLIVATFADLVLMIQMPLILALTTSEILLMILYGVIEMVAAVIMVALGIQTLVASSTLGSDKKNYTGSCIGDCPMAHMSNSAALGAMLLTLGLMCAICAVLTAIYVRNTIKASKVQPTDASIKEVRVIDKRGQPNSNRSTPTNSSRSSLRTAAARPTATAPIALTKAPSTARSTSNASTAMSAVPPSTARPISNVSTATSDKAPKTAISTSHLTDPTTAKSESNGTTSQLTSRSSSAETTDGNDDELTANENDELTARSPNVKTATPPSTTTPPSHIINMEDDDDRHSQKFKDDYITVSKFVPIDGEQDSKREYP